MATAALGRRATTEAVVAEGLRQAVAASRRNGRSPPAITNSESRVEWAGQREVIPHGPIHGCRNASGHMLDGGDVGLALLGESARSTSSSGSPTSYFTKKKQPAANSPRFS